MQEERYLAADKATELLNSRAVKRFEKAKEQAKKSGFDELTVIKLTKTLYQNLAKDNHEVFLELAQEHYEATEPRGEKLPDLEWLLLLLAAYNPVMKYVYDNEVVRKRDRTTEAVIAATAKVKEFRRGLSYWSQMTGWYADVVTDEATVQAYKDAGVKRVRWNTQRDDRECEICRERDGKEYPINSIPPKPHPGCRCYFTPVENKG